MTINGHFGIIIPHSLLLTGGGVDFFIYGAYSMPSLSLSLKSRLQGAKKIAILVIGSELHADDAAGILIGEGFNNVWGHPAGTSCKKSKVPAGCPHQVQVKVFFGGTAPENLTGPVKDFKATHVIMIDSADMGKKPGEVHLFNPEKIEGVSFCTHSLPINILASYLVEFLNCQIIMIGIQPKTIEFGRPVSKEVAKSIKYTVSAVKDAIMNI